jgi:processive 1,2-diacylglycerol beta-glucosyltransferase
MKVLVLTVTAGQGHTTTANAVAEGLTQSGVDCTVLDAYKYISAVLAETIEKSYLLSIQYIPKTYGSIYSLFENRKKGSKEFSLLPVTNNILSAGKMLKYLKSYNPDVVISTHIFCGTLMTYLKKEFPHIINIGIVTDYTIHPFWEETDLDYYVVANHLLLNQCRKKGIPPERVLTTGIPISEKFSRKMPKEKAREKLGFENKNTIMFMMGSMGFGDMPSQISAIDTLDIDFQIVCVCGRNEAARKKISAQKTRHKVYVYGFVDNIDEMMDAADFIITKPGGLSMSERLPRLPPVKLSDAPP